MSSPEKILKDLWLVTHESDAELETDHEVISEVLTVISRYLSEKFVDDLHKFNEKVGSLSHEKSNTSRPEDETVSH